MYPQLYHALHSRNPEDLPFWQNLVERYGDPVLELGCGTGRVLLQLNKAGFKTIGLDHSLEMLRFLRSAPGKQVEPPPMVVAGDMCAFHLAEQFPLIIVPCNTFSTLDHHQRMASLECVTRHLSPSGIFVVSMPNPDVLRSLPARSAVELEDEFQHPVSGNPVQVSSAWERKKDLFTVTWIYDHLFPDGRVEHLQVETRHHVSRFDAYQSDFSEAGLDFTEVYGDYDFSPFGEDTPSLIILAQRKVY